MSEILKEEDSPSKKSPKRTRIIGSEVNLSLAKSIVASYSVNTTEHPEFLEYVECGEIGWIVCERNKKVWVALLAIEDLIRSL